MFRDLLIKKRSLARVILVGCVSLCCWFCYPVSARGDLDKKQARKLIATMPGLDLKTGALRILTLRSIDATTFEATTEISTAFRFEGNGSGRWRVTELRTGPGQWQSIDVMSLVLKAEAGTNPCNAGPAARAGSDLSARRARCLLADLLGVQLPSDDVRIKAVSALGLPFSSKPSALVEAYVTASFRFQKSARESWHVTGVRTGDRTWVDPQVILTAVDNEKVNRARADLETIARALDEYRRQRGSFVDSKSQVVLIDFLSPRYLSRIIRVDPWHRPYSYEGSRDHFTLRSDGPDRKANTSDDVLINGPLHSAVVPATP
jgi:hypothetical protein